MEYVRLDMEKDIFLRDFTDTFSGVLTPEQAGKRDGPHVYFIVSTLAVLYHFRLQDASLFDETPSRGK